jgi:hypothetical protein
MSRGRPAKDARVERTRFIPSTVSAPLLQLRTGEITTDGRTHLHTRYITASTLPTSDSLNVGSSEGALLCDDWDKCPPEEEPQEIICEPSSDKRKRTAAVSTIALSLLYNLKLCIRIHRC